MTDIELRLKEILPQTQIKTNEPMKPHTTFKVGGPADFFVVPDSAERLALILKACGKHHVPYFILGNGSNVLVTDKGFRGVIISTKELDICRALDDNKIKAGAGVTLSNAARFCLELNLTGMEFACGIPGTVGGAVYMNAGAYGREIKDIFFSADVITGNCEFLTLYLDDMDFSYRKSKVQEEGLIVVSTILHLNIGGYEEIKSTMDAYTRQRNEKQPMEMPSAGSTFKRPPDDFAGKLIMDSGLRGYTLGGAQVSQKHCGFVVNRGNATAKDILDLIEHIKKTVREKYGVNLEPEVRVVGEP